MTTSSDYSTVARAIRFLKERFKEQPSLDEISNHVGLSPFHFQRLFTRWAGVSPKRFVQFLTVESAKERLRASEPILRAAFGAGLSGPARLHDLFVTTTAVTPGEFKARGSSLDIHHGIADTPFGPALLGTTPRGLCHLAFLEEGDEEGTGALAALRQAWPEAVLVADASKAATLAHTIFSGNSAASPGNVQTRPQPLSLLLKGTNFQLRVGLGRPPSDPPGSPDHLRAPCQDAGPPWSSPGRGDRSGPEPHRIPHPLPPGNPGRGNARGLPLGFDPKGSDPGMGRIEGCVTLTMVVSYNCW